MQHYNTSLQTSNTCVSFDSMHRISQETVLANSCFFCCYLLLLRFMLLFLDLFICVVVQAKHICPLLLFAKHWTGKSAQEQVGRAWENFLSRWLVVAPQFLACCGSWFVGSGQQSRLWTIFGQSADSRHWSRLIYGITSLSSSSFYQNLPSLLFFFNHNPLGAEALWPMMSLDSKLDDIRWEPKEWEDQEVPHCKPITHHQTCFQTQRRKKQWYSLVPLNVWHH